MPAFDAPEGELVGSEKRLHGFHGRRPPRPIQYTA
jgi:hypothetical protein